MVSSFLPGPLLEWHALAMTHDEDGSGTINSFSVVVSNASDWTKETIMNPAAKLWVRGFRSTSSCTQQGSLNELLSSPRSGIGPRPSLLSANVTPRRILWSTPHPEPTFVANLATSILEAYPDPDAIVWTTRTLGRPDTVSLTY